MNTQDSLKLSKAVQLVEDALEDKFLAWKQKAVENGVPSNIIATMEETHTLVLNYMYGSLGSEITTDLIDQISNAKG